MELTPNVNSASRLSDVSGLLWMLKMADQRVDTQEFTSLLVNISDKITNHGSAYFATHCAAALIGAEDYSGYNTFRHSINVFRSNYKHHDIVKQYESFALNMMDSLTAFSLDDFSLATSKLFDVRDEVLALGGSQTQHEFYYRLLYTSMLKMKDRSAEKRLLCLLNERCGFRDLPPSVQSLYDKLKDLAERSERNR